MRNLARREARSAFGRSAGPHCGRSWRTRRRRSRRPSCRGESAACRAGAGAGPGGLVQRGAEQVLAALDLAELDQLVHHLAGQVDQLKVSLKGVGAFNSENMQAKRATVSNDGASTAVVRVSDSLNATISGVGAIEYIGNPQVTKNISGLGTVRRR